MTVLHSSVFPLTSTLINEHDDTVENQQPLLFQDENGLPIKFFIQKDLNEDIQMELCGSIDALGGRVETKVPREGFVLVDSGTPEDLRLRLCWNSPERPKRYFVPYSYVEACKSEGMFLKQIFSEGGEPIKFHISSTIASVNARSALSSRIIHSGGDPTYSMQSAQVILADPNTNTFRDIVAAMQGVPDKHVESHLWVRRCIERAALLYTPLVYKNPGGRRPGDARTPFTEEDEYNMCDWIALKLPVDKGRTGNKVWELLVQQPATDPRYAWADRHTWQSWRERYKKNKDRLDKMIAQIVEAKHIVPGQAGQHNYVRAIGEGEDKTITPRKKRKRKAFTEDVEDEGEQAVEQVVDLASGQNLLPQNPTQTQASTFTFVNATGSQPLASSTADGALTSYRHSETTMARALGESGKGGLQNGSSFHVLSTSDIPGIARAALAAPANKDEDEEGLSEEESVWNVRIGDDPPPVWAKPANEAKNSNPASPPGQARMHNGAQPEEHVIDRGLADIAKDTRFTVEEVKEYYDKTGDMEKTRVRFTKLREKLQAIAAEEV